MAHLFRSESLSSARTFLTGRRGKILAAVAAGWFLSIGVRLAYPVLLPYLQEAYGLDLTTAGFLLTVLWLAYALGQLPGGILADRLGEGNVLVTSTVISAVTLGLVAVASSAPVVFVATACFGFGTALYGVARFTILSAVFPNNDGTAIGVTMAAGEVGNAVLPLVAGAIAATLAWQFGFGLAVPVFGLAALFLWLVVPNRTSSESSAVDSMSLETVRYVAVQLRRRAIIVVTAIQILTYCIWQAFTGFYPTYLIEIKAFSPTVATGLFSAFFALGIVVQPVTGNLYDRFGIRRSLPAVLGVIAFALAALPFLEGFWPIVGGTILLSSILGYGTMTLTYMTAAFPADMKGTGLGFLRTFYMTIGAASPVLFGALADRGFFNEGYILLAVLAVGAMVLVYWLPEG
ncbi:major facilitator superfamily transport protein [Natrialba magadii ATCC 43099]|uniref:Major facilitator superfamily protein n=1 Tax=Natrialba magadii (strain ATCC 43099 / DSM 3394 / CCM 3739 / CIP 104546 / IAM 13178 / JCM 8861 / NBRC 102185 / NCIMB 2190 / MS3) TaxID=547559 RepID=D3SVE5_NATMM|nr:MFS transporter [Natrialba magadii]ADD05553.2 major facilitator superfamily transport protein [Natrialba magadii ATCC 43099]ELY30031.1 major facilitator superfamily protein [Natrialba magadii ATCC 43099]